MGWLIKFLEKLGVVQVEEASTQIDSIHFNDLDELIDLKEQELLVRYNLKEEMLNYTNKLKDKRWQLECKIDDWEKKIKYLGIDYRSQEISLIFNETREFLELMAFYEVKDLNKIKLLNVKLQESLDHLQEVIGSSSFSYNYSFILPREEKQVAINPLAKELIEINLAREEFQSLLSKSGYYHIRPLRERIVALTQIQDQIKQLQIEVNNKAQRLQAVQAKQKEKEEELDLLRNNPENAQIVIDKNKKVEIDHKIEELSDQIIIFFSKFKSALSNYAEKNPAETLVQEYLNDPSGSLFKDEGLAILSILRNLQEQIIAGKITLLVEQNDLMMQQIKLAQRGKLEEWRDEYHYLLQQEKEVTQIKSTDKDFILRLEDAKYRVDHFTKQALKIQEDFVQSQETLNSGKEKLKQELELFENTFQKIFSQEIKVRI
ncbi:hypothetical protein COY27_01985 [Candidatus Woesearchaeota archaeon CG_4_10_14_0_2_um_filter_33_13]|nr:MAG: hypothetical protein COY27_01985 [Candidatus Woesearchaeota archaeon CG_4_10_14_0_2_um_filter_33_13]